MRKKWDTEINRAEALARYKEKQLLQMIATLEELDRKDQLSDRRMLAKAYRQYGSLISNADPGKAQKLHFQAFRVLLEMFEGGQLQEKDLEELSFPIWSINRIALSHGARNVFRRTKDYLDLLGKRLKELEEEVGSEQEIKDPRGRESYDLMNALFGGRPGTTEPIEEIPEYEVDEYVIPFYIDGRERRVVEKLEIPSCRILRFEEGIETVKGIKSESRIRKLILPSSVKKIDSYAFAYTRCMEEAIIPSGFIEDNAFLRCGDLKRVSLGNGVRLKGNPFQECANLKEINVAPDNDVYMVKNNVLVEKVTASIVCAPLACLVGEYVVDEDVREIGDHAFCYAKGLTSLVFQNGLNQIASRAFEGCENLSKIKGLDVVGKIGRFAFKQCKSLKEIELCAGVLERRAFTECIALERARINVHRIEEMVFEWCVSLTNVYLGDRLHEIRSELFFECTELKMIRLPGGLKEYPQIPYQRKSPLTLQVQRGSLAEKFAKAYNYPYLYEGEGTIHRTSEEISEEDRKAF